MTRKKSHAMQESHEVDEKEQSMDEKQDEQVSEMIIPEDNVFNIDEKKPSRTETSNDSQSLTNHHKFSKFSKFKK